MTTTCLIGVAVDPGGGGEGLALAGDDAPVTAPATARPITVAPMVAIRSLPNARFLSGTTRTPLVRGADRTYESRMNALHRRSEQRPRARRTFSRPRVRLFRTRITSGCQPLPCDLRSRRPPAKRRPHAPLPEALSS